MSYFNLDRPEAAEAVAVVNPVIPQPSETCFLSLTISAFSSEKDNVPKQRLLTWADLCAAFSKHPVRAKKGGAAWSPIRYRHGANRGNSGVESISCAVIDIDDGTPPQEVLNKVRGHAFLAHSSFSHTEEHPKYRLILPLKTPSPAEQWALDWARINHWLGNINDAATKDAARLYFMPCHPPGAVHFTEIGVGRPLDLAELPELPGEILATSTVKSAPCKRYDKVKIEGIEDAPLDPLNPAIGLARMVERCAFMKWASATENQNAVSNPLWMAMTSNACRFEESDAWIHDASRHYDDYDEAETDRLIARCRNFAAPTTCATIRSNGFRGCPGRGCEKRPGDDATRAPAGLWMHGNGDSVSQPASTTLSSDDADEAGRYVGGFFVDQNGVFHIRHRDGKEFLNRIASCIEIAAQTRDATGTNWGILVRVKDPDGKIHEWAMPKDMLPYPSTWKSELLKMGADIYQTGKQDLLYEYFLDAKPTARALCVMQPGWYQNAFVLPNRVIGDTTTERVVLQTNDLAGADVFHPNGTLAEWQEHVAANCVGNSRLLLVVCAALAGPMLHLLGEENGGLHLVGGSSIGKTTAVEVAASVWGNRTKFVRNWRTTSNAAESVASRHNDTLLILDEISQVSPIEAGEIAYMLGNGRGKSRSTVTGSARSNTQWRLIFLSTGEQSLAEHMQSANKRSMAGQEVRLVNLPADAGAGLGLFENLHGARSAQQFATDLKASTAEFYGEAGPALIAAFADPVTQPDLLDRIRKDIEAFARNYVPADSCGQVLRVGRRFALLAAVGEIATHLGILPWPEGESTTAARTCFQAWIDGRGGVGNQEADQAISQVRRFLETHGESRFTAWDEIFETNAGSRTINRAGFRRVIDGDRTEYYLLPEIFKTEVCGGLNPKDVVKALRDGEFLVLGSDGKSTRQERLPGIGGAKVYRVRPEILGNAA